MTDPQLANNTSCNNNNKTNPSTNNNNNNHSNNNNNHNNNNDGEPKYLHKKFKKMATVEVSSPLEIKKESAKTIVHQTESSEVTRRGPSNDVTKNINNNNNNSSSSNKESSKAKESSESGGEPVETKKTGYVCPYCKLSCSKPSVLQKHIRAHTNERPYPCLLCGFAFKTKSNLYKHRRSRAHSAKAEGTADQAGKVSEDSDISLSDSASNGTGTPPPPPSSVVSSSNQLEHNTKTVKTGKIYKPKFHTALESVNNETGSLSVSSVPATATSTSSSSLPNGTSLSPVTTSIIKPNPEQLQEHIDKIITDNQAIVEAVDPRLHKLMHRQQPQVAKSAEQPLNLSSSTEETLSLSRKRCHSEGFVQDKSLKPGNQPINQGSIIKDLLLKNRASANDDFVCTTCKISYTSADNLEAHRRYYCKGSSSSSSLSPSSSASPSPSPKREFQLDLEKRDELDSGSKSAEYYTSVKPLPSPGPLLGNTRLVDAYAPPIKKHRLTDLSMPPTSLRSLEELSKYPRPNSLQMFGGQVRILDNTGETKTMRIEPRQTNSPTTDDSMSNHNSGKSTGGSSSETSSIVVRSSLHSGGTMVHKPPGGSCSSGGNSVSSSTTTNCSLSNSISIAANAPKMLAPIIPNISTPNIAPTMTCYGNYLEPRLNPLTITAYNPLTLPQSGITSILHGGKIIPYVPGMPGPHTLMGTSADISQPSPTDYKIVPGIPGLEMIPGSQPLDLASSAKGLPPYVPGIPGPMIPTEHDQMKPLTFGPLDLAKDTKVLGSFKHPNNGSVLSPKVINQSVKFDDKYRRLSSSNLTELKNNNNPDSDTDRHILKNSKYKLEPSSRKDNCCYDNKNFKTDNINSYSNGTFERTSPKLNESRKRPASWGDADNSMMMTNDRVSPSVKYDSLENGRTKMSPETVTATVAATAGNLFLNGSRPRAESVPPVIIMDLDTASIQQEQRKSSPELIVSLDSSKSSSSSELTQETSTKFLRPSSLPLKPGTFTPKRHHGITPTLNTLPLISPETPRPRKSYGQLYLNGHAYTYLGLKCSTRAYYCTVNRPQPMYVLQRQTLSMYSNWKIFNQPPQDLELDHYDSRNRPSNYTTAGKKHEAILTHSSQRPAARLNSDSSGGQETDGNSQKLTRRIKIFDGGFESNEDYTYVRGRGRGRYVCEECGIRCKKPSMLKKHIRTHTDVRPYTCKYCAFSFKTKGNLTKHMKSKAHYKKCRELGIDPVPTTVCDENIDKEAIARLVAGGGENPEESSDEEEETDADESEESGSEEHEAAQSLLSLSQLNQSQSNNKNNTGSSSRVQLPPGLLPASRPTTYPYTLTTLLSTTTSTTTTTTATASLSASTTSTSTATVIQSESCNRYYFPSSRSLQDNSRDSVIRSTKVEQQDTSDDVPPEHSAPVNGEGIIEDQTTRNIGASQPMDLSTTKVTPGFDGCVVKRSSSVDILTPVSEPILMQTIVQTMERLPPQGREWKPDAEGHMLQAYLTERHVMDSKIKQQYRVGGASKHENNKKQIVFSNKLENCFVSNSRNSNLFSNSTPTVTYTDPSRMHHHLQQQQLIVGTKKEDPVKVEVKTSERRPFDIDSLHYPLTNPRDNQQQDILRLSARANQDYSPLMPTRLNYPPEINTRELIAHEQIKNNSETRENGVASHERQDFTPSPAREPTTPSRYERPPSAAAALPEFKVPCSELKPIINQDREQIDTKPGIEYRVAMEPSKILIPEVNLARQGHVVADARNNSDRVAVDVKINIDSLNKQAVGGCAVNVVDSIKQQQHNVARKMVVGGPGFRSTSPSRGNGKPMAEFLPPSSIAPNYVSIGEDGRSTCGICNKVFNKPSQLKLHINIHYFERPFRCESCAVSFRTKGHLTKHERSVSHHNKVSMTSTFGAATTTNPRPFKCTDCKIAFRIHGHLAKHLRSKMHIMKLECIGKLPFGTYAEMERSGVNLNDIDTTDCDNSLASLQMLAKKLYDQDPSKIGQWDAEMIPAYHQATTSGGETSSDEGEPIHPLPATTAATTTSSPSSFTTSPTVDISSVSRAYHHLPNLVVNDHNNKSPVESHVPNSRFDDNNLSSSSSSSSSSLPYKCQMCAASYRTGGELQVHCFVEHNVDNRNHDSGKENTHIKISNEDTSNVHDKNDDT